MVTFTELQQKIKTVLLYFLKNDIIFADCLGFSKQSVFILFVILIVIFNLKSNLQRQKTFESLTNINIPP